MISDGKPRRACTLLKVGRGQPARPMVAKRPLFNYWAILMPHFRGVLLPPQNRSDESIQWTWTETTDGNAVSAAELATIRKRLAGALQSLADSLEDTSGLAAKAATIRETKDRMDEVVSTLVALSDAALAGFVARTDRGILLHSWGLANPLPVQYLDADFELAGRVLIDGGPASGQEVILETVDSVSVARTGTNLEGRFEFPKVAAGSYRVRVVSRPPEVFFPEKGEVVELFGSSITTVEIRNEDRAKKSVPLARGASSGGPIWILVSAGAAILAVVVYFFWPGKAASSAPSVESEPSAWEVNSAPRSVAQRSAGSHDEPKERSAQAAMAANAAGQQAPKTPGPRKFPTEALPEQKHSRAAEIVVAQRVSGLPPQQAGLPSGAGGIPSGSATSGAGGAAGGGQAGGHSASPASGTAGNANGTPSAAAGSASISANPTAPPSSLPPQVVSPPGPDNMSPPAGRPQGSRAREVTPPSDSKAQAGSASPVGTDSQSANGFQAENTPAENTHDKAVSAAAANPDAPFPAMRSSASDLPDLITSVPEETGDKKERGNPKTFSDEGDDMQPLIQQGDIPAQAGSAIPGSDFTPVTRMSFSLPPWRRLLLRDAIVPTLPTRIGQNDALSDLSTRVLAEKQASLPLTLQDGRIVLGIRIEFSASFSGRVPHWVVAGGGTPLTATADESAAEIGWSEVAPRGQYVLTAADGHRVATIFADPQSGIRVSSADGISSWPWVGIECAPGEAERFDWQVLGAASVPLSWTKDNQWKHDRGRRLDLRWPTEKDETVVLTLAIVDALTGWARASKIEYQQKIRR